MILLPAGLLVFFTGVIFSLGPVKPNYFCGFRNRWTLADNAVWDCVNRYCGEFMVLWGAVLMYAHSASRVGTVALLVAPALFLFVASQIFSAILFQRKWLTFDAPLCLCAEKGWRPSPIAESIVLILPLVFVFLFVGKFVNVPEQVPVAFSVHGSTLLSGSGSQLVKVYILGFVLSLVLSVWTACQAYPSSSVGWSFYVIRFGSVSLILGYGLSSWLMASSFITSPIPVLLLPFLLVAGGGLMLLDEAVSGQYLPQFATAKNEDLEEDSAS